MRKERDEDTGTSGPGDDGDEVFGQDPDEWRGAGDEVPQTRKKPSKIMMVFAFILGIIVIAAVLILFIVILLFLLAVCLITVPIVLIVLYFKMRRLNKGSVKRSREGPAGPRRGRSGEKNRKSP